MLAFAACADAQVSWRNAMRQPREWYGSAEAVRIADQLLLYQFDNGGWEKNIDMAAPLDAAGREKLAARKRQGPLGQTTIDNDATYTQMRFLAKVYTATQQERFAAAFRRGLGFVLEAQYPNGGWPQFYPLRDGYWRHITYNDDAMIGVMETLRSVVNGDADFLFVSAADRKRCEHALAKGIECILKTQVRVSGKLTAWCAQHDENTLAPAKGRAYEHPSLSGAESVAIVEFLMGIEHPSPDVVRSIRAAVEWFEASKINGIRVERKPAADTPKGFDMVVVPDPNGGPVWARFYEIGTNRPIFSGRDSVIRYRLADIEYERRTGYRWYVDRPAKLLKEEYPKWLRDHKNAQR